LGNPGSKILSRKISNGPVDIVSLRETMNVYLKRRIQSEAVYA
jgi:hypothetical protein